MTGLMRRYLWQAAAYFVGMSFSFGPQRPLLEPCTVTLTSIALRPWASGPASGAPTFLICRMEMAVKLGALCANSLEISGVYAWRPLSSLASSCLAQQWFPGSVKLAGGTSRSLEGPEEMGYP